MENIVNLAEVTSADLEIVGGKNASLGEMIQNLSKQGIHVPGGFATTAAAYKKFLAQHHLDKKILKTLASLQINNVAALNKASAKIRHAIMTTPFFPEFKKEIAEAYAQLKNGAVAVRSSATAEDLPKASFAGQQETFLNVKGLNNVLHAIKLVYASLFTSRAIAYRCYQGFDRSHFAMSVGIQPMVRSDKGSSGVIFTLDTESGFDQIVLITASYGLGETIVQGQVNPDEYYVYKPMLDDNKHAIVRRVLGDKTIKMIYTKANNAKKSTKIVKVPSAQRARFCLTDKEIQTLAQQAVTIEKYYGCAMDIEWAKDGIDGKLYILQARPETVKSQIKNAQVIERYEIRGKGTKLVEGQSIGNRIGYGKARIMKDLNKMDMMQTGDVLVTEMTDPDWEPIMKRASAIVTDRGGRTCHAAIIARELGIPAIVGCGNATTKIKNNMPVTVSCAEGQIGWVYAGKVPFTIDQISVGSMPKLPLKISMNMGNPNNAFATQFLPNEGVGLARLEFIISQMIGIHPNAILALNKIPKPIKQKILRKTLAYGSPKEFYIEKLREGIATIAAAFFPKEVIFRFSDFKSNEYANLLGGKMFEPFEENPMIGFRGASRYRDEKFRECFKLECKAFKRVRDDMGLINAQLMVPFVRTVPELKEVIALIEKYGLKRGVNGLKIYMMCEIPSNALLAEEFLQYVDGFSIGSNDLTQLVLGLDRDSSLVAPLFDERNAAIKILLHNVIQTCNKMGKYIGICGQAPSDHPDFAVWLMEEGIQNISLNPDTVLETWLRLSEKELSHSA